MQIRNKLEAIKCFFNSNLTKFSQNFLVTKAIRETAWGLQQKDKHNPHKQCPERVSTTEKSELIHFSIWLKNHFSD